jgi:hypothetical protein
LLGVTVRLMSEGELRRLEVVRDVDRGGLPVGAAAQLLGRSERQQPQDGGSGTRGGAVDRAPQLR